MDDPTAIVGFEMTEACLGCAVQVGKAMQGAIESLPEPMTPQPVSPLLSWQLLQSNEFFTSHPGRNMHVQCLVEKHCRR